MSGTADLLKPTEAAVVSGVELSIVNHAIDRALPARLVRRGRGRGVSAEACFYIAFYHASASKLTADERRFAIFEIDKRVEAADGMSTQTHHRWDRYVAARRAVESDPEILGGAPVIAGTRVPVHDVAASLAAGLPIGRIRTAYPSLSEEQIELASLYARANPLQGRPPERRMIEEAKVLSRRVVERRRTKA